MNQTTLTGKYLPDYSTAKSIVGKILKENLQARNDDKVLIREVVIFCLYKRMNVPSYETITRCRRKFNQDGLYLPDESVQKGRQDKEVFFRESAESGLL